MTETDNWYSQIKATTEAQEMSPKDYRFYNIKRLLKFAKRTEELQNGCLDCKRNKTEVEYLANNLENYFTKHSLNKRDFEKRFEKIFSHLKTKHNFVSETYYASIYTLWGMVIGFVLSGGLSILIFSEINKKFFLFGLAIFLIAGRIYGSIKDKNVKQDDKSI